MTYIFEIILLLIIFILLITQTVTVRFFYSYELIITFDFFVIQYIIYPSRNKNRLTAGRKKKKTGLKEKISNISAMKAAFDYLFQNSQITVNEINIQEISDDPAKYAVRSQSITGLIMIALTYLSLKADSLISKDNLYVTPKTEANSLPTFDLTLKTMLHNVILVFIIYLYKRKRKAVA